MCLIFLCIRSMIMIGSGGQCFEKVPADSVFRDGKEKEVLVQGQVYDKTDTSNIQILYLKNNSSNHQKHSFYDSRIVIYNKTPRDIEIGKIVKLKGKTAQFEEARNPGNFNRRRYYQRQKVYGFVWCEEIVKVTGKADSLKNKLYRLKTNWKVMLIRAMGEKNGNIMGAVLLGEKSGMDEEIRELYQKNGIGHILAISGLHISFIGLSVYYLLRRLGGTYRTAGIGAVLFLGGYVLLIGLSVSVIRACIMLLLRIGADVAGRVYDMATALFLAAAVTVLWQPLAPADAGFLMSYGAIFGIIVVLPAMESLFPCKSKILKGFYASASIDLMLFPVLLYFYFEFPVYSLLLNMVVLPLMSWVLGLGMAGGVCALFWSPLADVLWKGCGFLLEIFEMLGRCTGRLPGARIVFGQPDVWQIVLYYALLLTAVWRAGKSEKRKNGSKRWLRISVCAASGILFLVFRAGHGRLEGRLGKADLTVTMLDVGQGDGIFLRGPEGRTYLIDGGSSDVKQVGKYRIEPFLKSQGVEKLDYIFLSHGDSDHYSGAEEMIARMDMGVRIENLVLPANYQNEEALCRLARTAKAHGIHVAVITGGTVLKEGDLRIACIQPSVQEGHLTGNAGSMVLDVSFGNFDMLCTGDVEEDGEEALLSHLNGRTCDVLKAAHHGSKNASGEPFLECVQPKIALISAGEGNRYGHPHEETLERLKKHRVKIYNTQTCGAVTLRTDGKRIDLEKFFSYNNSNSLDSKKGVEYEKSK